MADGPYQLIEVKGDNKIDDVVVKAKQAAAEEMAVASGVRYLMCAGSKIMYTHILEDDHHGINDRSAPAHVVYSFMEKDLPMVAEPTVEYGKKEQA